MDFLFDGFAALHSQAQHFPPKLLSLLMNNTCIVLNEKSRYGLARNLNVCASRCMSKPWREHYAGDLK
jgi:hypothetical protein